MVEPSEGLERRILLRLLKGAVPLDTLRNALQRKAVLTLRSGGLVHNVWSENPGAHQLALTSRGEKRARKILVARMAHRRKLLPKKH